jgi:hypothetical protein
MKRLLIIPIFLFAFFCKAQDSKDIIGKPIKIGNLLVAQYDLPSRMNWRDAKVVCTKLGKGWRLPSKKELNTLYENQGTIGGFARGTFRIYWSSTENNDFSAWVQSFLNGTQAHCYYEEFCKVRAVRSL